MNSRVSLRSVCEVRTVVSMWSECGLAVWLDCAVRTYRFNTELLFRLQQQDRLVDGPDGAERARRSLQAQGRLLPRELLRQREAQRNLHTNTHHYAQYGSQVAERLGSRASNLKVASSIPGGRAK